MRTDLFDERIGDNALSDVSPYEKGVYLDK
jgi:hypothetical protein